MCVQADLTDEFISFIQDIKNNITRPIDEFIEMAKAKLKELKKAEEEFRAMRDAEIRRDNMGKGMVAKLEKNGYNELAEKVTEVWPLPTREGIEDYVISINDKRTAELDANGNPRKPQDKLNEKEALEAVIDMLEENTGEANTIYIGVTEAGLKSDVNIFEIETAACEELIAEFEAQLSQKQAALDAYHERIKAEAEEENAAAGEGEEGSGAEGEDCAGVPDVKEEKNPLLK